MLTFRNIVEMGKDMDENDLDKAVYLSKNIDKWIIKGLFNINEDQDEYDSIVEEIYNSLYINIDYSSIEIGSSIVDTKVEELNKLSNIDTVIKHVTDYNGGNLSKQKLTEILSHYIK